MKSNITDKQLKANKKNALKWGIKTQEWKKVVRYNAVKHWLSSSVYDKELESKLITEYNINWTLEKMLVKNTCISNARYEKWVIEKNEIDNMYINLIVFNRDEIIDIFKNTDNIIIKVIIKLMYTNKLSYFLHNITFK
jgi:hypothetical protein